MNATFTELSAARAGIRPTLSTHAASATMARRDRRCFMGNLWESVGQTPRCSERECNGRLLKATRERFGRLIQAALSRGTTALKCTRLVHCIVYKALVSCPINHSLDPPADFCAGQGAPTRLKRAVMFCGGR